MAPFSIDEVETNTYIVIESSEKSILFNENYIGKIKD